MSSVVSSIILDLNSDNNSNLNTKKKSTKKVKTKIYCNNCGEYGHGFKSCSEPITSYGLINIDLNGLEKDQIKDIKDKLKLNTKKTTDGINIINHSDIEKFSKVQDKIKFLMIRRRHTLGFMEFVRGHYKIDNIEGIIYLFKQMVKEEIDKISTKDFDTIWSYAWGEKNNMNRDSEYKISKDKFEKLKEGFDEILNLDFYVDKVKPKYETPEWGFPKGRRNYQETDLECALREFEEESSISNKDINLLDLKPVEESFTGTNGVLYRHVYYLCVSENKKSVRLNPNNKIQTEEIGDIGLFSFYETLEKIRPYHTERIKIVSDIYMSIIDLVMKTD